MCKRSNLARDPTDWKAGCPKRACPVWREGRGTNPRPYPYPKPKRAPPVLTGTVNYTAPLREGLSQNADEGFPGPWRLFRERDRFGRAPEKVAKRWGESLFGAQPPHFPFSFFSSSLLYAR